MILIFYMSVTTQAVHHMQRDVRNQKQDSSIQIAILTIPLQSSAIQGEDLVEGYKELERGLCNARNPQQSCNPTSLKDNDKTQMHSGQNHYTWIHIAQPRPMKMHIPSASNNVQSYNPFAILQSLSNSDNPVRTIGWRIIGTRKGLYLDCMGIQDCCRNWLYSVVPNRVILF